MGVNELLGKLRTDPEFAAKYSGLNTIDQLQAQLKSDGYNLSTDEIKSGLAQLKAKTGELSDADLAGVTGGSDDGQKVGFYRKTCPECGGPTRVPAGELGVYWYCTKWPECKGNGIVLLPDSYDK